MITSINYNEISPQKVSLLFKGRDTTLVCAPDSSNKSILLIKYLSQDFPSEKSIHEFDTEYVLSSQVHTPVLRKVLGKTVLKEKPALILEYIDGCTLDS